MIWKPKSFFEFLDVNFYENNFPFQNPSSEFFEKKTLLQTTQFSELDEFLINYLLRFLIPQMNPMILLNYLILHLVQKMTKSIELHGISIHQTTWRTITTVFLVDWLTPTLFPWVNHTPSLHILLFLHFHHNIKPFLQQY